MESQGPGSRVVQVGAFELDIRTGELTGDGRKIQLAVQPLQVFLALLEHPGELVTREQLVARLWPSGTFVDFDHSLNKAVNKLREGLGDSAEQPRFIETLPRRGYRLIAPVVRNTRPAVSPPAASPHGRSPDQAEKNPPWGKPRGRLAWGLGIVVLPSLLALMMVPSWRHAITALVRPRNPQVASLAVLPLENLSGDPEQAFFADGLTDALITEIAKAGAIRVISRTSVMRYKSTRKEVRQIGRELNVDAVVEGTVLRSGERVRITAQLIQVSTDMHLWADSYERGVSEILALQQEVATDIARQIGSVVKPAERPRTVNPQAYGAFLKGRFYFQQYTSEGWLKAIEYFNQSIEADPNFAPAYAGLAESYLVARGWNAFPPDEALQRGKAAAQKAMQLDGSLAASHLAMGAVYSQEWDFAAAEREFSKGLELSPNDSLAWQQHGNHLLSQGRFQEAIAEQERARTLDPFSLAINANLARAFYYSRRYDDAIAQAQATLKMDPRQPVALMYLERSYRHKGMFAEALAARMAASPPDEARLFQDAYRSSGYRGVLLMEAEQYKKRTGALVEVARAYAQAGEKEKALALLEECYRRHWSGVERMKVDPDFDPLRSDRRYQDLMAHMHFQE